MIQITVDFKSLQIKIVITSFFYHVVTKYYFKNLRFRGVFRILLREGQDIKSICIPQGEQTC